MPATLRPGGSRHPPAPHPAAPTYLHSSPRSPTPGCPRPPLGDPLSTLPSSGRWGIKDPRRGTPVLRPFRSPLTPVRAHTLRPHLCAWAADSPSCPRRAQSQRPPRPRASAPAGPPGKPGSPSSRPRPPPLWEPLPGPSLPLSRASLLQHGQHSAWPGLPHTPGEHAARRGAGAASHAPWQGPRAWPRAHAKQ